MPTYQYRCTDCGTDLEVVQKFTDTALTECPTCGGSLRKIFNAVGVVFKGSGFYRTDSRTGNGADSGSGSSSATKESAGSSGSTSGKDGSGSSGSSGDSKPTPSSSPKTTDSSGSNGSTKPATTTASSSTGS